MSKMLARLQLCASLIYNGYLYIVSGMFLSDVTHYISLQKVKTYNYMFELNKIIVIVIVHHRSLMPFSKCKMYNLTYLQIRPDVSLLH